MIDVQPQMPNRRWPRPTELPMDLRRGVHRDRLLWTLDLILKARYKWAAAVHAGRRYESPVNDYLTSLVVAERNVIADGEDVVSLTLRAADGGLLEKWYPGAHLDLYLPSGRVRQYSLCGDPSDRTSYRVAVRRIPGGGGGSLEVHNDLKAGTTVLIRGPRNAFGFVEPGRIARARHVRFVAGGIGITPILPMMHEAERLGVDWTMVFVGRERRTLPFLAELEQFGARVQIRTDDEHGLPTANELLPVDLCRGDVIYCCGPEPLMELVSARVRNEPGVELHAERFSAAPVIDGRPFQIQLSRTGVKIDVNADQTALDAVLSVNPDTPFSCRQGFCGTCLVFVTDGDVDHRDKSLTQADKDKGKMLLCVSRSNSPCLTLDI